MAIIVRNKRQPGQRHNDDQLQPGAEAHGRSRRRRHITLNEVNEETGISRPTLTHIVNIPGYKTNTHAIDALCRYLECTPGELLQMVDDE